MAGAKIISNRPTNKRPKSDEEVLQLLLWRKDLFGNPVLRQFSAFLRLKKTNKFNMFHVDFAYIWAYSHINLKVGVIFIDQSRPDQKQLITRDWFEEKKIICKGKRGLTDARRHCNDAGGYRNGHLV